MAANEDGSVIDSTSYLTGVITGVDYKDGLANLLMGEKEIPISAVIRVEDVQGFENI